jgi:UDP:flavonoid glycosyltransferase YjiC (YdhE family)
MRILLAASGGEGHLGPLLPFAQAARDAGDEVLVVVPPEQAPTVEALELPLRRSAGVDPAALAAIRAAMASADAAIRSRLAEVELFGRLCTAAALPATEAAARTFRPDLILREPCDYASALVALRGGIPAAQVAISPGRADLHGLRLASEVLEPSAPGVTAAVEASPYLTRFPELDSGFADTRPYRLPSVPGAPAETGRPLVWLTLGTVDSAFDAAAGTWRAALEALAPLPVDVVASVGRGGPALHAPANTTVVDWVGLEEILGRAALVVCHGGSGTTLAALGAGLPVVVVPMLADQPTNAAMIERAGAGIAVRPAAGEGVQGLGEADVPRLRAAITEALADGKYAAAARAVADRLTARPSVPDRLAELRRR